MTNADQLPKRSNGEPASSPAETPVSSVPEGPHELWVQERDAFDDFVASIDAGDERRPPTDAERAKMDASLERLGDVLANTDARWTLDGALNISLLAGDYIGVHKDIDIGIESKDLPGIEAVLRERGYGLFLSYPKDPNHWEGPKIMQRVDAKVALREENIRGHLMIAAIDRDGRIPDTDTVPLNFIDVHLVQRNAEGRAVGVGGAVLPEAWFIPQHQEFHGRTINRSHPAKVAYFKVFQGRSYDYTDLQKLVRIGALTAEDTDTVARAVEDGIAGRLRAVDEIVTRVSARIMASGSSDEVMRVLMEDPVVVAAAQRAPIDLKIHALADRIVDGERTLERIRQCFYDVVIADDEPIHEEWRRKVTDLRRWVADAAEAQRVRRELGHIPEQDRTAKRSIAEQESAELTAEERHQLADVWARVVLGGRVVAPDTSRQTPEEFRQWLHESLMRETSILANEWGMVPDAELVQRLRAAETPEQRAAFERTYLERCQELFNQRTSTFRPTSERSAKWDSWPDAMRESGSFNCAGSVLLGMQLLEAAGMRQCIGNPVGHVVNVAQLSDGSWWYIDFLNRNVRSIQPTEEQIAGMRSFAIREEGIEYRHMPVLDPTDSAAVVFDNLSSLQHDAHESGASPDDLDVQAARAYVDRFPGILDTMDLEPPTMKLSGRLHAAMETSVMRAEEERVRALHTIGDDPRIRAFREEIGDRAAQEGFLKTMTPVIDHIHRFLAGEDATCKVADERVRRFVEIVAEVMASKAARGTELYRELVEEFVAGIRRVPPAP